MDIFKQASDSYIQAISTQGTKTIKEVNDSVTSGTNSLEVFKDLKLKEIAGAFTGYITPLKKEISESAEKDCEKQLKKISETSSSEQSLLLKTAKEKVDLINGLYNSIMKDIKITGINSKLDKGDYTGNAGDLKKEIEEKINSTNGIAKNLSINGTTFKNMTADNNNFAILSALNSFYGGFGDSYLVANCYWAGTNWKKIKENSPAGYVGISKFSGLPTTQYVGDNEQLTNSENVFTLPNSENKVLWEGVTDIGQIAMNESINNFLGVVFLVNPKGENIENTPIFMPTKNTPRTNNNTNTPNGSIVLSQYGTRFVRININYNGVTINVIEAGHETGGQPLAIAKIIGVGRIAK